MPSFDFPNPLFIPALKFCSVFMEVGLCWTTLRSKALLQKHLEKACETWDPFVLGAFKAIRLSTKLWWPWLGALDSFLQGWASPGTSLWNGQSEAKASTCKDCSSKNVSESLTLVISELGIWTKKFSCYTSVKCFGLCTMKSYEKCFNQIFSQALWCSL